MMKMKKIIGTIFILIILALFSNVTYVFANAEYTEQEQNYIKTHKEIYIAGNANLEPIESWDGDSYEGILPEIFKEISNVSGISFVYINKGDNSEEYARNNQVEIISGILEEDLQNYNIKDKIALVHFSVEEKEETAYIAFTQIADDEIISIVKKSLEKINELDKTKIIILNSIGNEVNPILKYILMGSIIILTISTIIFLILYRKQLNENKFIDSITKMENYQQLEKIFNENIKGETRCAYCIVNMGIDINHIEQVYGYSEVEKILKDIAYVLNKFIEPNEKFARIYKDTFIIIADCVSDKTIIEKINYIVDKIKEYEKTKNVTYELNVVAGVYFLKQTDDNLQQAVYYAMKARNEAKAQGSQAKVCTDALMMKIKKENRIEKEIITALNNKEFTTYAQPLLNLKNEKINEIEILARWESPKMGLIKPNSFIRVLENNNIMDKLDFLMYEKTCEMLAELRSQGKELCTAFCNFSRSTIEKKGFFEELKRISKKYEIQESYIGIIIGKTSIEKGITNMQLTIEKLKSSGFTILLDDIETLSYSFREMKDLPIDYIKISAKLTENLNDSRTVAIVKGIIETVHGLGIKVICEDFNTRAHENTLRKIGCDTVQGNAYFQPIPTDEIIKG